MSRLTKRYEKGVWKNLEDNLIVSYKQILEKLAHYEDLEEQGRLIEVVRCKDCKFFHHGDQCAINGCNTHDEGYCYKAKLAELKGGAE